MSGIKHSHLHALSKYLIVCLTFIGGFTGTRNAPTNAAFLMNVSVLPQLIAHVLILGIYSSQLCLTLILLHPLSMENRHLRARIYFGVTITAMLEWWIAWLSRDVHGQWKAFFLGLACIQHAFNAVCARNLKKHNLSHSSSRLQSFVDSYSSLMRTLLSRYRACAIASLFISALTVRALWFVYQLRSSNPLAREMASCKLYYAMASVAFIAAVGSEDRRSQKTL